MSPLLAGLLMLVGAALVVAAFGFLRWWLSSRKK